MIWPALSRPTETFADTFLKVGMPPGIERETKTVWPQFTALVKKIAPAVVNISVESGDAAREDEVPSGPAPKNEGDSQPRSLGSGFIVAEDGYIVTNNHVVDKSDRIIVRLLDDKTEYDARVVGKDQKTDLALLKIDVSEKLPYVFLGNSDELEVGEWVFAIGNQFQLGHTVSAGIVSALSRKVRSASGSPYDAYIQTDASINPGSSGGPLINTRGQVVGINTAIFSPSRGQFGGAGFNIGIGFAIPINLVKSVVSQLKEHGRVTRGLLGVIIQPIDADVAAALGLKNTDGALVADVNENTPAFSAGFKPKDVIVSYNGKKIADYGDLPLLVGDTPIGQTVKIEILRNGELRTLSTAVIELKETAAPKKEEPEKKPDALGLIVSDISTEISQLLGRKVSDGVVVLAVEVGSAGSRAGIDRGDVIEELAGRPVHDVTSYEKVLETLDQSKAFLALVRRKDGSRFVVFRARHAKESGKDSGKAK